jgi:hypothetical protein
MPDQYDISRIQGLSESQVARRLAEDGPNELPGSRRRGTPAIAFEVVREPMFLLLVACGVVYLLLGEPKEALMLLASFSSSWESQSSRSGGPNGLWTLCATCPALERWWSGMVSASELPAGRSCGAT